MTTSPGASATPLINASATPSFRVAVRRVARDPLVRTASPLVINTGANALLGVAFWVVAARLFDEATVATNTAVVAAMATLSGIAQLNLGQGLAVLVPRSGAGARRVVVRAYAAVSAFGLVVLGLFIGLVLPHLELASTLDSPSRLAVLAIGVLTLNLFALQDAALIALRKGRVVPVENTVFGAAKLLLLVPFAALLPAFGIFTAWVVPMVLIVPVVSGLIVLRRRPAVSSRSVTGARDTVGGLALDYVGYLFHVCSTMLMPVIALELLPPLEAAVFSVAWLTSSTIDLIAYNVGTALMVEASYGHDSRALRSSVLRRGLPLVVVVAVVGVLAAPLVLGLYGPTYADNGVATLQLLLCATVARSMVTFAVAEARAHRQIGFVVWMRAQNTMIALTLAVMLAPRLGLEGLAVAWLCAQGAGALVASRRLLRRPRVVTPA